MKHTAKFTVLAGSALLLAIVTLGRPSVKAHVGTAKANGTIVSFWADGGIPVPPFPSGSLLPTPRAVLSADGGIPVPPFPPSGNLLSPAKPILSADGGIPVPPFPSGSLFRTAIG